MNEKKYTPGPWSFITLGNLGYLKIISKKQDSHQAHLVAQVCPRPVFPDQEQFKPFRHVAEANASLIASAPELLEALIHIEEYWNRDSNNTAMHDALWHIIETAQEAIANAKGKL